MIQTVVAVTVPSGNLLAELATTHERKKTNDILVTCIGFVLLRLEALSWNTFVKSTGIEAQSSNMLAGVECQEGGFMKCHFTVCIVRCLRKLCLFQNFIP